MVLIDNDTAVTNIKEGDWIAFAYEQWYIGQVEKVGDDSRTLQVIFMENISRNK